MIKEVARSYDLSERLVRLAAHGAPPALRERLAEEWLADLQARPGSVSRLRFALGCAWASQVIAAERPALALAGAGHGRLPMDARTSTGRSRRAGSLLLVLGLHVGVFYACWTTLSRTHAAAPRVPFEVRPLPAPERPKFHPDETVELDRFRVSEPPPPRDPPRERDPELRERLDPRPETGPTGGLVPPIDPPPTPHRVAGAPAAGFPNVDDFYPANAIRNGEQGATAVQVCVNPQGRIVAAPATVQSSGYADLDAAALRLAKAGSGHYRPATEDGRPVTSCFAYAVRFHISNVRSAEHNCKAVFTLAAFE